jgi:hypothetical protein
MTATIFSTIVKPTTYVQTSVQTKVIDNVCFSHLGFEIRLLTLPFRPRPSRRPRRRPRRRCSRRSRPRS